MKRQLAIVFRFLRTRLERALPSFFRSHPRGWRIIGDDTEQHQTVILVHGTFAWRKERHGIEWWQWPLRRLGKPAPENDPGEIHFVTYLKEKAGGAYRIRPARWPQGDNSEHVRRSAGKELLALLRTLDEVAGSTAVLELAGWLRVSPLPGAYFTPEGHECFEGLSSSFIADGT